MDEGHKNNSDLDQGKSSFKARYSALKSHQKDFLWAGARVVWPLHRGLLTLLGTFFAVSFALEGADLLLPQAHVYTSLMKGQGLALDGAMALGLHLLILLSILPIFLYATQKIVMKKELTYLGAFKQAALWKTFAAVALTGLFLFGVLWEMGRMPRWTELGIIFLVLSMPSLYVRLAVGAPFHFKKELERYILGFFFSISYSFLFSLLCVFFVILMTAPALEGMRQTLASLNVLGAFGLPLLRTLMSVILAYGGLFCVGALAQVYAHICFIQEKGLEAYEAKFAKKVER